MKFKYVMELVCLRRHVIAFLAFLGFVNVYMLRVNLSIGVVAMTQNYTIVDENGIFVNHEADFNWNSKEKGMILSSFFYGYILTQIPGGWLASRIGGTKLFGIGILATGILTILTPLCIYFGLSALISLRVLEGFFEGVSFPSMHEVWFHWAPPEERTRLVSFALSGTFFGTMIAFPLCGFLTNNFGWTLMFYITGALAVFWFILWITFVRDDPTKDPWISSKEILYLKETLADTKRDQILHSWKKLFISMPFWAIIIASCCECWGFCLMLTQLPSFMTDILQFELQTAGFLSAIPYLVMSIMLQVSGFISDIIRRKQIFTTTQIRKICVCSGFSFQTVFLISASYANSAFQCILFITLAIGLGAISMSGYAVNHLDIAPQYAGVLLGVSNSFATISGIVSPIANGFIVKNKTREEWRYVFVLAGIIYMFGALFYVVFASAERQPWAMENNIASVNSLEITVTPISNRENNLTSNNTHF